MDTTRTLLTLEQYAALDEAEDEYTTELVCGRVVREPRPGGTHGNVQVRVAHFLQAWALEHGAWVCAESGFILERDPPTVRGPDVAVRLTPLPDTTEPGGWIGGAPDVAVEVLSPSDRPRGIRKKVGQYLEAGARLVWIVDPAARAVTVHRPDGSGVLLEGGDALSGDDVLDGFQVGVGQLFG